MKITTAEEMRTIDRITSEKYGVHSLALMEAAGTAVAQFARSHWPTAERITIVCGKGNNGGDGFVAARRLHSAGKVVEVLLLAEPSELKGDAANMFARLPFRPVILRSERDLANEVTRGLANSELIIDAVVGTGFQPPAKGLLLAAIDLISKTSAPVLAVDIPSGASSDAFGPQATPVMRADAIVTFTAPRPAHLFSQLTRGPVIVAPIGSPEAAIVSSLNLEVTTAEDVAFAFAPRDLDSNKGRFGHVLVIGGSLGKSGAAAMTGAAALRAGAGLVTVASPRSAVSAIAAYTPELMTEPLEETAAGALASSANLAALQRIGAGKTVIAIGPGLSRDPEAAELARALVRGAKVPVVVDADGLNAFESAVGELNGAGKTLIVTPHPGEMARLTGKSVAEIQDKRIGIARTFAQEHQCIVVLKGFRTLVTSPDGAVWVNPTGNPGMATGGTGDILTGMIAGIVAQFPKDAFQAVCAAVYLHGVAGDLARDLHGEQALIATDLLRMAGPAIKRIYQSATERMAIVG